MLQTRKKKSVSMNRDLKDRSSVPEKSLLCPLGLHWLMACEHANGFRIANKTAIPKPRAAILIGGPLQSSALQKNNGQSSEDHVRWGWFRSYFSQDVSIICAPLLCMRTMGRGYCSRIAKDGDWFEIRVQRYNHQEAN